jgi:hypothetical protein
MKSLNGKTAFSILILLLLAMPLQAQFPANMDFIFLIDVSGSMEFSLDGVTLAAGSPPTPGASLPAGQTSWERLYYVKEALPVLGNIVENILAGSPHNVTQKRFAFGIFPGMQAPALPNPIFLSGSGGAFGATQLRAWSQCEFNNILGNGCPPAAANQVTSRWNGTPIKSALNMAIAEWAANPPATPFGKIIFLLTDGKSYSEGATVVGSLAGINIAAIGFGVNGVSNETDYPFLYSITSPANVATFDTDLNSTATKTLTNLHVQAFFNVLTYPTVSDPGFIMTPDSIKTFAVEVTEYDQQLYFVTAWNEPKNSNKVGFTLQTPSATITPQNAASLNGVSYTEGATYKMYAVNPNFLQGHLGTWKLIVDGSTLSRGTKQITDYLVGGPSTLRVNLLKNSSSGILFTTDSLRYVFQALAGENILKGLDMKVELATPSIAPGNWFAKYKLSASELKFVRNLDTSGYVSDTFKKSYYLQKYKMVTPPKQKINFFKLFDDGKNLDQEPQDGTYGFVLKNISQPGLYRSRLLASGKTPTGQAFTREYAQTHLVEPRIEGNWSSTMLNINLLSGTEFTKTYEIKFTPKDRFGNYLAPGQAENIKIDVTGKRELVGGVEDDLQGSYTQIVIVPSSAPQPTVAVSYKDIKFPSRPLVEDGICYKLALRPYIGNFYFTSKLDIRNALTYGIRLTTCLNPRLAVEGEIGLTPTEDTLGKNGVMIQADGGLTFDLTASRTAVPYLSVGGGWLTFKNFSSTHRGGTIYLGSGIKFRSSNRLAFTVDAKDYIILNAFGKGNSHNLFATVGLSFTAAK